MATAGNKGVEHQAFKQRDAVVADQALMYRKHRTLGKRQYLDGEVVGTDHRHTGLCQPQAGFDIDAGLDVEVDLLDALLRFQPAGAQQNRITAFGLVPLLFATGPGSEIQRPLAIVVIGGLASSTLLTLVLLPVLYRRFGVPKTLAVSHA